MTQNSRETVRLKCILLLMLAMFHFDVSNYMHNVEIKLNLDQHNCDWMELNFTSCLVQVPQIAQPVESDWESTISLSQVSVSSEPLTVKLTTAG